MGVDKDADLGDPYGLLEVDVEATEKEINTAYRKASLKCHPDRNPDDSEAPQKFDRLTRAKDLLLDPARRAEVDHKKKAKHELEHRFAQEDSKRRKLREDLEGREAYARDVAEGRRPAQTESVAESRKRFVKQDFTARIKQREAELAGQQAETLAKANEVRHVSLNELEVARVRVTWKEGAKIGPEAIKEFLVKFDLKSLDVAESSAVAQLGSREDTLRAVLAYRERKHSLPFNVSMFMGVKKQPGNSTESDHVPESAASKSRKTAAGSKVPGKAGKSSIGTKVDVGSFGDWEKDMLANLAGLAAKKKTPPSG